VDCCIADAVKVQLARSSLVPHLLKLFSECASADDCDATEKLAADLVVLILTGGAFLSF
jgi:hypothetical protein